MSENNKNTISVLRKVLMVSMTIVLPFALMLPYVVLVVIALPLLAAYIAYLDVNDKYKQLDPSKTYSHSEINGLIDYHIVYTYLFIVILPFWIYINFVVTIPSGSLYALYDGSYFYNNYILEIIYNSTIGDIVKTNLPASRALFKSYGYPLLLVVIMSVFGCISLFVPYRISYYAHKQHGKNYQVSDAKYPLMEFALVIVILSAICLYLGKFYELFNSTRYVDYKPELKIFVIISLFGSVALPFSITSIIWKSKKYLKK